jgi:hypothetical protein
MLIKKLYAYYRRKSLDAAEYRPEQRLTPPVQPIGNRPPSLLPHANGACRSSSRYQRSSSRAAASSGKARVNQMREVSESTPVARPQSGFSSWSTGYVPCHDVELCDEESGKGDAAIKSQALGLLNPGMKRSQTPALTVP